MLERGGSREEVQRTVDDPEITFSDTKGNPCFIRAKNGDGGSGSSSPEPIPPS